VRVDTCSRSAISLDARIAAGAVQAASLMVLDQRVLAPIASSMRAQNSAQISAVMRFAFGNGSSAARRRSATPCTGASNCTGSNERLRHSAPRRGAGYGKLQQSSLEGRSSTRLPRPASS
jgi:hypothetical protein